MPKLRAGNVKGHRECFVLSPIGPAGSPIRKRADDLLEFVLQPVLEETGYKAVRADKIAKVGVITSQIIDRIVNSPLVIADLSGGNPNVFYELAIRHATRLPYIQLIDPQNLIPFDVSVIRTIQIDLTDIRSVNEAKAEIGRQIAEFEQGHRPESPISLAGAGNLLQPTQARFYETQVKLYAALTASIASLPVRKATLVQYSGVTTSPLVDNLLAKGATVDLYVVDPTLAISKQQTERIKNKAKNFPDEFKSYVKGRFNLHYYDTPASVGGALIDDQILAVGWYTYQRQLSPEYPNDAKRVRGSDQPGFLLNAGSREFEVVQKLFHEFVDDYHDRNRARRYKRARAPVLRIADGRAVWRR